MQRMRFKNRREVTDKPSVGGAQKRIGVSHVSSGYRIAGFCEICAEMKELRFIDERASGVCRRCSQRRKNLK